MSSISSPSSAGTSSQALASRPSPSAPQQPDPNDVCSICLDSLGDGSPISTHNQHMFHRGCLSTCVCYDRQQSCASQQAVGGEPAPLNSKCPCCRDKLDESLYEIWNTAYEGIKWAMAQTSLPDIQRMIPQMIPGAFRGQYLSVVKFAVDSAWESGLEELLQRGGLTENERGIYVRLAMDNERPLPIIQKLLASGKLSEANLASSVIRAARKGNQVLIDILLASDSISNDHLEDAILMAKVGGFQVVAENLRKRMAPAE